MAYDWLAGKSVRAVEAENGGLLVASKLAARIRKIGGRYRKCTAADVAAGLAAHEWHHTSKFFNKVNYYDFRDLGQLENRQMLREAIAVRLAKPAEEVAWRERLKAFRAEAEQRGATRFSDAMGGDYLLAAGPDGPWIKAIIGEIARAWDSPIWKEGDSK